MNTKSNKISPNDHFANIRIEGFYNNNDNTKKDPMNLSFTSLNDYDKDVTKPKSASILLKAEKIEREGGLSAIAIFINFLKGMIGPGCLSLPLAFKQAGLWTALFMVFLFGFLNNFCMLQLVHCSQRLSRKKGDAHMDYGTLAYEACAHSFQKIRKYKNYAKIFVNVAIVVLQIGICSVFYVFIAAHLKEVFDERTTLYLSVEMWMLLIFIPIILINFVRTLRAIAVISTIGNFLMIAAFIFIIQHLLQADHKWSELPWITNFKGIMTACGSILYSFEGQAMVLPLENKLKNPHSMVGPFGVLSMGMSVVTVIYAISGVTGFITYGEEVEGSITLNLPRQWIFSVVRVMLIFVIYFSYVIQQYVIVDMLWPKICCLLKLEDNFSSIDNPSNHLPDDSIANSLNDESLRRKRFKLPIELTFRALLVLITMIIAIAIPNLADIISLVGVTSGMFLAFIIPATIDTILFLPAYLEESNGKFTASIVFYIIRNILLCITGLFGLIFGLKSNLENILSL